MRDALCLAKIYWAEHTNDQMFPSKGVGMFQDVNADTHWAKNVAVDVEMK